MASGTGKSSCFSARVSFAASHLRANTNNNYRTVVVKAQQQQQQQLQKATAREVRASYLWQTRFCFHFPSLRKQVVQ